MIRHEITIINKLGLHARAASKFVTCASAHSSKIMVGTTDDLVDGKSIMSIMLLAATQGTMLQLEIEGDDEQEALDALTALIENRFDEEE